MPIIASDAGGIPLQVKHGQNGWIVPSGDSSAVSSLLLDIYTGKAKVHRDLSTARPLGDDTDPNSVAESFVKDFARPMPPVKADKHATSEDFWTVGNATKWMYLATRILGLNIDAGDEKSGDGADENEGENVSKEDERILRDMGVGEKWDLKEKGNERNVWEMVMGSDLVKGEGVVREHQ